MKVQLDSALPELPATGTAVTGAPAPAQPDSGGAPAGKPSAALAETADGIRMSGASTVLKQSAANGGAKITRLTGEVQTGSYVLSSAGTANAIVEDVLSGRK